MATPTGTPISGVQVSAPVFRRHTDECKEPVPAPVAQKVPRAPHDRHGEARAPLSRRASARAQAQGQSGQLCREERMLGQQLQKTDTPPGCTPEERTLRYVQRYGELSCGPERHCARARKGVWKALDWNPPLREAQDLVRRGRRERRCPWRTGGEESGL